MKFTLTNRRKWLIGAGATLLLTATPSFALFGLGDIVFDPTSYASLVQTTHHAPDAVQHDQEQSHPFLLQAAVANYALLVGERQRSGLVW